MSHIPAIHGGLSFHGKTAHVWRLTQKQNRELRFVLVSHPAEQILNDLPYVCLHVRF